MTSHLTIPGSLEWDSPEVERLTIATLRYAGGKEHDVRYVSEVHYDAALAREAALREELAALRESYEAMRDRKNSIVDLQQRLTFAERRAGDLETALINVRETLGREYWDQYAGLDETRDILDAALKPAAEGEGS